MTIERHHTQSRDSSGFDIDFFVSQPRAEFVRELLKREEKIFRSFGFIFNVVMVFSLIISIISFSFLYTVFNAQGGGPEVLLNGASTAIQYWIIFYIAKLCASFSKLRAARIRNETFNASEEASRIEQMSKDIQKKIDERAREIKTGENSIVISNVNSTIIGDISPKLTLTFDRDKELRDALAILIASAEQTGREDVVDASRKLAMEASKSKRDRSIIFDLWNKIVAAAPKIAEIAEVARAILKIMT